jgi:hypothetical protein
MKWFTLLVSAFFLMGAAFPSGPATVVKSAGCPTDWSICPIDDEDEFLQEKSPTALAIIDWISRGQFPIDTDVMDWQDDNCQPRTLSQYLHCIRNNFKAEYVKYDIADPVLFERGPPQNIDTAVTFLATENVALRYRVETLETDLIALTARVLALETP